jgi:hypothetical protein
MGRFLGLILGSSRLTSVFGYLLGAPGIYDAIVAFGAGQPINVKSLVASVVLAAWGRISKQEKFVPAVPAAQ